MARDRAGGSGTHGEGHGDDDEAAEGLLRGAGGRRVATLLRAMARPLTLLLVRHGQSEWNAAGLMQGQTPHPRDSPTRAPAGPRRSGS